MHLSGTESMSNLPLQIALYFNVYFFPFWVATVITMLRLKYDCLSELYQFIQITTIASVFIIEVVRLYLGYSGNMKEKVPELAAFWLLSLLLQLPLQGFLLLNEAATILPMERAVNMVMASFVVSELGIGFWALRGITKHQARRLDLQQLQSLLAAPSEAEREASG